MHKHNVPDIPYAGDRIISARITPETHRQLRELAARKDCAVAAVIKVAVDRFIEANAR